MSVAASCPSNIGSKGVLSRWRMICNDLSDRDRTGILRRNGPVIEINEEALVRCEERVRYRQKSQQKIQRISGELGAQFENCQFNLCKSSESQNSTANEGTCSTGTY